MRVSFKVPILLSSSEWLPTQIGGSALNFLLLTFHF
jgi:hypothetical protein